MAEPSILPTFVVLGGPNGAGKSTAAAILLPAEMTFVNADEVAKGLPDYPSHAADLEASRLVLEQMDELEADRADFAVETTLAGRSLAARGPAPSRRLSFRLIFLTIPEDDLSVSRVAFRVANGGHHIPENTIRRRFVAGPRNFFRLYKPVADKWEVYETSKIGRPILIAEGTIDGGPSILEPASWDDFRSRGDDNG